MATASKAQEFLSFCISTFCAHSPFFGAEQLLCMLFCEPVRLLKWVCIQGTECLDVKLSFKLAARHSAKVFVFLCWWHCALQVVGDLMVRIQRIPDFTPKLLLVRKRLLGLEPEGPMWVNILRILQDPWLLFVPASPDSLLLFFLSQHWPHDVTRGRDCAGRILQRAGSNCICEVSCLIYTISSLDE